MAGERPQRTRWRSPLRRRLGTAPPPQPESPRLTPARRNPILTPDQRRPWESKAVFNPAAVVVDGTVHMLYRAIGEEDRSALGYAVSETGFSFSKPIRGPAYVAREPFEGDAHLVEGLDPAVWGAMAVAPGDPAPEALGRTGVRSTEAKPAGASPSAPNPSTYVSGGGGAGGVEDPRMTRIGDRIYMTYVAYNGFNPPRVALTSIGVDDFTARHWSWEKPVLVSGPGVVNKNAVLFPEKVRGKYVMIHRIYPNILLDYLDDLEFDGKTRWLTGHHVISPSVDGWDNHKVGAGPPPIRTSEGWLLICQGVGKHDGYRYKVGAMLLDARHPERVIARPREPILEPDEWYTNQGWKAGVVYPCGAVVKDDQLFVYYGGADTYVCLATAPFDRFVRDLTRERRPRMSVFRFSWPALVHDLARRLKWPPRWRRRRSEPDATV